MVKVIVKKVADLEKLFNWDGGYCKENKKAFLIKNNKPVWLDNAKALTDLITELIVVEHRPSPQIIAYLSVLARDLEWSDYYALELETFNNIYPIIQMLSEKEIDKCYSCVPVLKTSQELEEKTKMFLSIFKQKLPNSDILNNLQKFLSNL